MKNTNSAILIENLKDLVNGNLPGLAAQQKMSPTNRNHTTKNHNPKEAIDSSVLVLLYSKNNELYIPFIQRTSGKGKHSGQISFPGGKCEPTDADYTATALRETQEELGITTKNITIIGNLTELYIPVSNFMVYPVLAYIETIPPFNASPSEVENIIEMPVKQLLHDSNIDEFSFTTNGFFVTAPYFKAKGHKIWGATAMILSELKELLDNLNLLSERNNA